MRQRLVLVSLAVSSMVALAFVVPLGLLVREVAEERAVSAARRDAGAVAPALAVTTDAEALRAAVERTRSGSLQRLAVHLQGGETVGAAPVPRAVVARARATGTAISADVAGGRAIVEPVVVGGGEVAVVAVHVPEDELRRGVPRAWLLLLLVAAALVAGSVLVADRLARTVVEPARRLEEVALTMSAGDLGVRAAEEGPGEIRAVGAAFNQLAGRIHELLARERELVADLSHRLRTPLTALQLDAEALGPGVEQDRIRDDAVRLTDAVSRLIDEARRPRDDAAVVDLAAVVRERALFWSSLAEDQGRPWEVDVDAAPVPVPVPVTLPAGEIEAAVDALLGNVFAHTPDGAPVRVRLEGAAVHVEDGGPGFDGRGLARGRSGGGSTGLGLDIARRTAEAAGGSLEVGRSDLGGARVTIRLG